MLSLRKPSPATIRDFLAKQSRLDLTYAAVGATAAVPPAGYVVDHARIKLGAGEGVFRAAKAALERWEQFRLGWLEATPQGTAIKAGEVVAVVARAVGLWWLKCLPHRLRRGCGRAGAPLRVRVRHFARGHTGSGKERSMTEWDRADDGVWFDILAFSRRIGS